MAQDFDFQSFELLLKNLQQYVPTVTATAHSTRCRRKETSTTTISEDSNEDERREDEEEMGAAALNSLSNNFDREAKELVESLTTLSMPSNLTPNELF